MKQKILFVSLIAILLISPAWAVSIRGRAVSTIADVLRFARELDNVSNQDTKLELGKSSLVRLHDDSQLDLHYNIGSGDTDLSLGQIREYSAGYRKRDNGFIAQLAKTNFNGKKVLISSSRIQAQKGSFSPFIGDYNATN